MYSIINKNYDNDGTISIIGSKNKAMGLRMETAGASLTNKNLISISSTGSDNIGIYASNGNVINDTAGKITVTAGENIGIMATGSGTATNKGDVTVTSDGSVGVVQTGGTVNNEKDITVTGKTSGTGRGTAGIIATGGIYNTTAPGNVNFDVEGKGSLGIYSKSSTVNIETYDVKVKDQAVNFVIETGGSINLNGTGTATTGQKSLLFYTNGGTISINQPMSATIDGVRMPIIEELHFTMLEQGHIVHLIKV